MSVMFFIAAVTLTEGSLKVLAVLTMDAFVTRSARNVDVGCASSKNAVSPTVTASLFTEINNDYYEPPSDLGDNEPCQPMVRAPKSKFGKKMRSFQTSWYANREWLEYSGQRNACYCFPCRKFLASNDRDKVFTHTGFQNWKTGTETGKGLNKHSSSTGVANTSIAIDRSIAEC